MEYRVTYDPVADALYVKVRDSEVIDSIEVRENVIVDLNKNGEVVGVELINFSKSKINLSEILMKGIETVAKP